MPNFADLPALAARAGAAVGLITLLLILAWIVILLGWNITNWLRLVRVIGGRYVINHVGDPRDVEDAGQAVLSRIVDELNFAGRGARTLQSVDSPDAAVPVQVASLPEPLKALAPLINLLVRQNRFVITVTLLPVTSDEADVHVLLSKSTGRVLESRRFTEPCHDKGDELAAYTGAAMQAGAWLAFMLDKHMRSRLARDGNRRVELLGTRSWQSYAFLCRGLRHAQTEAEKTAWYNAALREDHRNIGALIALGAILARSEQSMHFGIRHLQWAREQLGDGTGGHRHRAGLRRALRLEYPGTHADPKWFQATYALAIALLHRHDNRHRRQRHDEQGCLIDAIKKGTELAQAIGATQLTLASWWRRWAIQRGRRVELRRILDREDTTLASVVAASKASLEMQHPGYLLPPDPAWQPCDKRKLWKRLRGLDPEDPASLPPAESLLNAQLCSARCTGDEECHLDQRTRYNRACFHVRSGNYDKALEELKLVFAHVSAEPGQDSEYSRKLLRWAADRDPALDSLRGNRQAEFTELIERADAAAQGLDFSYPDIA